MKEPKFKLGAKIRKNDAGVRLSALGLSIPVLKVMSISFDIDGGVSYHLSHWSDQAGAFIRNVSVNEEELYDWETVSDEA